VELTADIPNDPVVFRDGFPDVMRDRIIDALIRYASTPAGIESLKKIASVEGLVRSSDAEYAAMERIVVASSVDVEKALRKSKK
jgi:phosphonate transport system substrate-binding protein